MHIETILPLAFNGYLSYNVPDELSDKIKVGSRVVVPFGKRKIYMALVVNIYSDNPSMELRDIIDVVDESPITSKEQLKLWQWVAQYYMVTLGEVLKGFLPTSLKADTYLLDDNRYEFKKRVGKQRKSIVSNSNESALTQLSENDEILLQKATLLLQENKPLLVAGRIDSKTDLFKHILNTNLKEGGQALILTPDSGNIKRYKSELDCLNVATYENTMTVVQKHRSYFSVLESEEPLVVVGRRSAVALPFSNLKIVIIDSEHNAQHKQSEIAPRFNARDTAIVLSKIHSCPCLLFSESPSIESLYNSHDGKYNIVEMPKSILPKITLIDRRGIAKKEKREHGYDSNTRYLSNYLISSMERTVAQRKQVLLFQNRRGFSSYLICKSCGELPRCSHCSVSLTYHKSKNTLECHYCGFCMPMPKICPSCSSNELTLQGVGTENIEEKVAELMPLAKIARIDTDTIRGKKIIEIDEADIIIGTQMASSGFSFKRLSLIGVVNCDTLLNMPDFRATETTMQLLTHFSNMLEKDGEMVIQGSLDNSPLVPLIKSCDYNKLYDSEINHREQFCYPPLCKMMQITLKHLSKERLDKAAIIVAAALKQSFGSRVAGPDTPLVDKVRGEYIVSIMLKIEKTLSLSKSKEMVAQTLISLGSSPDFRRVKVVIDIDPFK